MDRLSHLLVTSMEQYRELLGQTRNLAVRLGSLPGKESILAYQGLLDLQRSCRSTDDLLVARLLQSRPDQELAPLLDERMALIAEVLEENRRILPLLLSRKAILAAELNQSREGQGALAGYRSNGSVSGRLLSRSC